MPLKVTSKQARRFGANLAKPKPIENTDPYAINPPWPRCYKCGSNWGSVWRPWGGDTSVKPEHFGACPQ